MVATIGSIWQSNKEIIGKKWPVCIAGLKKKLQPVKMWGFVGLEKATIKGNGKWKKYIKKLDDKGQSNLRLWQEASQKSGHHRLC